MCYQHSPQGGRHGKEGHYGWQEPDERDPASEHYWKGYADYTLEVFGDTLKKRNGWKNDLTGLDAIHYYLVEKHHWLPSVVRAMSLEDLRFALTEEMHGWTLPKDALGPEDM